MKKYIIAAILFIPIAAFGWGIGLIGGGGGGGGAPSYLYSTSFEETGTETDWTQLQGTCDWDSAIPGAAPTGSGSECVDRTSSAAAEVFSYTYGSDIPISYTRFYMYVTDRLATFGNYIQTRDSSDSADEVTFYITQGGTVTNILLSMFDNNINDTTMDTWTDFQLNTWYCIEVKYDVTGSSWEWWIDGVSEGSGALTGTLTSGAKIYRLGQPGVDTATVYYDLFAIDDSRIGCN